ncbi:TA system antitoxin ParD family protein [Gordonia sp. (in: high G+C Gram-positive bacteria)]|uniref:TA system antitoxin ParD family protein n=1 Tax=Gordonia sp. (in: high G+C Gram-positive bacteria) TaxID=84139 RepID=UPI003F986F1C
MMTIGDKVTRFSGTLVDAAADAGQRRNRSARQQLEHWVRIGQSVSEQTSNARRRVEQALAGELASEDLTEQESIVFNAEVEAGIAESLPTVDFGAQRAARGLSSVALDDDGNIVEYFPDGTTRVMGRA